MKNDENAKTSSSGMRLYCEAPADSEFLRYQSKIPHA